MQNVFRSLVKSFAVLTVMCAAVTASAQTNMYRWVDKDGKVHFSDQPPPAQEKNVQQRRVQGNVIEVDKVPYGTRDAMKRNPVVLYTATSCDAYCAQARSLLTKRGVPFTEKVVDRDEKLLNELKRVSSDTSVPFLLVGTSPVKGFDDPQWQSALDGGGYPRVNANVGEIKPTVIDKADEPAKSKADGAADAKTDGKSATKITPAATATK